MEAAAIIAAAIMVVGIVLYAHHRLTGGDQARQIDNERNETATTDDGCCGMHVTCKKDSLLSAVSTEIVYYDDEELDAYAGRKPESYTEQETEQFRDVLVTLLPDDIAGWARSIQLRGIELPQEVRDELLMIISEARAVRNHA